MSTVEDRVLQERYLYLAEKRRNGEIVEGMVRSVGVRKMPVMDEKSGKVLTKEVNVAIFDLGGGYIGYCPMEEFGEHTYNSLTGFVGYTTGFVIERLQEPTPNLEVDADRHVAIVSVKKANRLKRERFWDLLKVLEKTGELQKETFEGSVTGYKLETQRIYVLVEGQECFMDKRDWDHDKVRNVADVVQRNMKIKVKVTRFNEETGQVQVSRKLAKVDPFEILLKYQHDDAIVGRVTNVHPEFGIFVQVEEGVRLKASKPRHIESPDVGDIVRVTIKELNKKERKGRVVIHGYPNGKKTKQDVGSFLYG